MRQIIILLVLSSFIFSCNKSEKDIAGIYLKNPSVYIVDSLFIYSDSLQPTQVHNRKVYKYKQVFYEKKTSKLLFENNGIWWLGDGRLELMNFYFNTDNNPNNYSYSKETINNAVTFFSTELDGEDIIVDKGVYYRRVGNTDNVPR
jgi:hypothetical protein